jgi:hypothetical protein
VPGTPIAPVANVTISDCDFGTPRNGKEAVYVYNARGVVLTNVTIAGQVINQAFPA